MTSFDFLEFNLVYYKMQNTQYFINNFKTFTFFHFIKSLSLDLYNL